jgi:TatD DNase family protein
VIDTHAHLDALADPPDEVLARARAAGVERVVTIGSGLDSARKAVALAERRQDVFAAVGIHPHQANDGEPLEELKSLLRGETVALGEIGLDFFRDYAPREAQLHAFEEQLRLAQELRKPVVVHSRAAEEDTTRLLEVFAGTVVLHCFSSPALLPVALERGYYVSFAGNVTFPNGADLRVAAAQVPADRILAETDAPYLAPQPVRGRPCEPAHVVHTLAVLAQARGEDSRELAGRIDANATRAFGLPRPAE